MSSIWVEFLESFVLTAFFTWRLIRKDLRHDDDIARWREALRRTSEVSRSLGYLSGREYFNISTTDDEYKRHQKIVNDDLARHI